MGDYGAHKAMEVTRLLAEVERLRAALRPFAEIADRLTSNAGWADEDLWPSMHGGIRVKTLRAARAALSAEQVADKEG